MVSDLNKLHANVFKLYYVRMTAMADSASVSTDIDEVAEILKEVTEMYTSAKAMNIIENNKMLAIFSGAKTSDGVHFTISGLCTTTPDKMKFNTSLDWIVYPMERIEQLYFEGIVSKGDVEHIINIPMLRSMEDVYYNVSKFVETYYYQNANT